MTERWLQDPVMSKKVLAGPLFHRTAKLEEMTGIVRVRRRRRSRRARYS